MSWPISEHYSGIHPENLRKTSVFPLHICGMNYGLQWPVTLYSGALIISVEIVIPIHL
jgi:hypothetical protein